MELVNTIFDRLDAWRHFPNYQLERRADIFFSLYLPEVLEDKLKFAIRSELVPEFPVRTGAIYPDTSCEDSNTSKKIDYVALSADGDKVVLVELKTDLGSRSDVQDKYLAKAKDVGLFALLEGLLDIFRATEEKRKYFCLLRHLESTGLLHIPDSMKKIMARPTLQGATEESRHIEITAKATETHLVYIQPDGRGPSIISFGDFADIVRRHDDPVSQRFALSLCEWAKIQASEKIADLGAG